jgi:phage gp36-like protein
VAAGVSDSSGAFGITEEQTMAYCALTDLEKLLPASMLINLSDDTNSGVVNQDNIDEAIDLADREIDAYLIIAGHSVPMTTVPPLVSNLSQQIAIWKLHLRKYFNSEIWRDAYKDCIRILERIAEGKLSIGQEVVGITQTAGSGHAVETRVQKFTEDFMGEF